MKDGVIRALAICLFRHDDRILVAEFYDPSKRQTFYRPLGGGIEFGEYARDALTREIREELGAEIADVRYLGTLENIFVYNGRRGHEVVFVFDAAFVDQSIYGRAQLDGIEDDATALKVAWKSLEYFHQRNAPLYPDGLLELMTHDKIKI